MKNTTRIISHIVLTLALLALSHAAFAAERASAEDILAATQDLYFQEDTIGQYLAECIDINSDGSGKASFKSLYNHYLQWWEEYHGGGKSKPFGKKSFGDYLQKRGMVPVHSNGRHYLGLSISDPYRFTATE